MDKRQQDIQVGAGQTESRLNREFIDFLRRISWPVTILILVGVLGYVGYERYQDSRRAALATAFADLQDAVSSGNPTVMLRVAEDHAGQGAVPTLARLAAADALLWSAVIGLEPGATVKPDGTTDTPEDLLTPELVASTLDRARAQYATVADDTRGKPPEIYLHLGALFGLAALEETAGGAEAARAHYQAIIAAAERAALPDAVLAEARQRLDSVGSLAPALPSIAAVRTNPLGGLTLPIPQRNQAQDPSLQQLLQGLGQPTTPTAPTAPNPLGPGGTSLDLSPGLPALPSIPLPALPTPPVPPNPATPASPGLPAAPPAAIPPFPAAPAPAAPAPAAPAVPPQP